LDHNITCSLVRDDISSLLFLVILVSLELRRYIFGRIICLASGAIYSLEGLQLGVGLCFLHDLVSVFHQNFLNEWLLI
jgi:hypothetical protein